MKELSLAIKDVTILYNWKFMMFVAKAMIIELRTKIAK